MRLRLMFWLAVLLLGLGWGDGSRPAVAAGTAEVKIAQVDASDYPRSPIKVFISVTDSQGSPLMDLEEDDFSLTIDGEPLVVSEVAGQELSTVPTPIQLVLAIDTSGRMAGEAIERAREAAIQFVDQLRPGDKVAIWQFSDKPVEVQTFTDNKNVLKDRLAGLEAGRGQTALHDTLFTISRAVMARQGRRALIVVTHGKNDSTAAPGELMGGLAAAVDAQAPAYMLGFGPVDEESLETVARETGGEFFREPAADGVGRLFTQLKELLEGQYELQADIPVEKVDGKEHLFEVAADVGGRELRSEPYKLALVQTMPIPEIVRTLTARAETGRATPVPPELPPIDGGGGSGFESDWIPWIVGLIVLGGVLWWFMKPKSQKGGGGEVFPPTEVYEEPWRPPTVDEPSAQPTSASGGRQPMPFGVPSAGGLPGGTVIIRPVAKGILAAMDGPLAGQQHELSVKTQGRNTWEIGREGPQDVVLNDPTVSRRHAKVKWEWEGQGRARSGGFVIYDLAAANPVEVNGQEIVQQALKDGDRIKIGATTFVFKVVEIQSPGTTG